MQFFVIGVQGFTAIGLPSRGLVTSRMDPGCFVLLLRECRDDKLMLNLGMSIKKPSGGNSRRSLKII